MSALRKPSAPVVKLKPRTHATLQALSQEDDRPMGEIVGFLVDRYARERFWLGVREDLERLKADPVGWKGYQDEIDLWDQTSGDGLDNEEPYYTSEEEREILAETAARRSERG